MPRSWSAWASSGTDAGGTLAGGEGDERVVVVPYAPGPLLRPGRPKRRDGLDDLIDELLPDTDEGPGPVDAALVAGGAGVVGWSVVGSPPLAATVAGARRPRPRLHPAGAIGVAVDRRAAGGGLRAPAASRCGRTTTPWPGWSRPTTRSTGWRPPPGRRGLRPTARCWRWPRSSTVERRLGRREPLRRRPGHRRREPGRRAAGARRRRASVTGRRWRRTSSSKPARSSTPSVA